VGSSKTVDDCFVDLLLGGTVMKNRSPGFDRDRDGGMSEVAAPIAANWIFEDAQMTCDSE